jgi:hypothetical protein
MWEQNTEGCSSVMCPATELALVMSKNLAYYQNIYSLVRHTKSALEHEPLSDTNIEFESGFWVASEIL